MYLYIHSLIYAPLPLLTYAFLPFLPLPHPIPILPYPPLPYPLRLLQIPPNQRQRLYPSYTLLTYAFLLPYSTLPLSDPTPLGLSHPILSYSAPTLTLPPPTLLYPPPQATTNSTAPTTASLAANGPAPCSTPPTPRWISQKI